MYNKEILSIMAGNKNLHAANKAKNDEFYTQMVDIEKELFHYRDHFKGKVVFCNCDDPYESNFFKYFALNFNSLGLKKLICTCYDGSPITGNELVFDIFNSEETRIPKKTAYKVEITEVKDMNGDGAVDLADVRILIQNDKNMLTQLKGNGDFRSEECIELLKEADIVVTNPPFSLFREYVAQLVEYNKKFLILGNMNAIQTKEIFPLIKNNKIWIGFGMNLSMVYKTPYKNTLEANMQYVKQHGYDPNEGYVKVPAICWYTNLEHNKRHEKLILWKNYNPIDNPKYDNYDAIEVSKKAEIPVDYDGIMGVPITFLEIYCPDQFEIVWQATGNTKASAPKKVLTELNYKKHSEDRGGCPVLNGKRLYGRILIRKIKQIK